MSNFSHGIHEYLQEKAMVGYSSGCRAGHFEYVIYVCLWQFEYVIYIHFHQAASYNGLQ